jgi:hypothetical protein
MSRPCTLCHSSERAQIDRQLRAGVGYELLLVYLKDLGVSTSKATLSRHAQHVLPSARQTGPKVASGDFLRDVVSTAAERMASGEIAPGIRDGISAEQEIGRRRDRATDTEIMLRFAQVLGGVAFPVIEGTYTEVDDEFAEEAAEDEELFRRQLTPGAYNGPLAPQPIDRQSQLARVRR